MLIKFSCKKKSTPDNLIYYTTYDTFYNNKQKGTNNKFAPEIF